MLDQLFPSEVSERLRSSRLGDHLESFAMSVVGEGYAPSTIREQLRCLEHLSRWIQKRDIDPEDLDERVVGEFLAARLRDGYRSRSNGDTVCRFLAHLRAQGTAVPEAVTADESSPLVELVRRYEVHLSRERGLAPVTIAGYRRFVKRFLTECFDGEPACPAKLMSSDISSFVLRRARSMSPKTAQLMVSSLRSFLRFLVQAGEVAPELADCVPSVASWRLATIPKYLSGDEVERLLAACDRTVAIGRRDHAILILLARLGLRASEVVMLELGDIDWRAGEILVRGKGSVHDRLPLLREVGESVATYLHSDRPECSSRRVFITAKAPRKGLGGPSTICTIFRQALDRAGLEPAFKGSHLLRHSLATGMLRRGATIAQIGDVLRHRSPQTTEIYAKVDILSLRSLAQPWPTTGGR